MPLDSLTVFALAGELSQRLTGGRIDKVQQPERDMLLLFVRSGGENLRLLLSSGVGNARVHITQASFENPAEPPMFCMLMRKHLVGARIASVYQPEYERMLVIELDCRDELGFTSRKRLIAELIGRSSNLSLVDGDGRIIDCMRRMDFGGDALRRMLPGMIYRMPPKQSKAVFLAAAQEERQSLVCGADRSIPVDKWLLSAFSGLSPLICREAAYRCGDSYETLPQVLDALYDALSAGDVMPFMLLSAGKPAEFSFMPIRQYGSAMTCERFDSFSELLDAYYSRRDKAEQQRRRSRELARSVKTVRDRIQRKLAGQREELKRTESREDVRISAELVKANIYRLKKGDRTLECENYYEPGSPVVQLSLDPLKTPQQNAAALFKEYNKLKAAESHLTVLVAQGERELDYLNSVLDELERAESEKDLGDIRRELTDTGYLKKQRSQKPVRIKPQAPLRFCSDDGFEILVGRNNLQNDELTTKTARRTDLWLHAQKVHGSHVIICCNGGEPPARTVEQAASLAAYYSQGRESGKLPIDYTQVRLVRKPSGSMPGKVIYTEYKTMLAAPDEALADRLKETPPK